MLNTGVSIAALEFRTSARSGGIATAASDADLEAIILRAA
jgi:hypothetical protein